MVYGKVEKAPCILWKDASQDTSTKKYIYTLPDRYDMPITNIKYANHYGNDVYHGNYGTANLNPYLSMFSGTYLYIFENYHYHSFAEGIGAYTYGVQVMQNGDSKIKLVQSFNAELPNNSVADNIIQVVQRRIASSWNLIDFAGIENNIAYNYLGEEDNVYISSPELAISKNDDLFLQYSEIPDNSLSNLSDIETDQDLITLQSFRPGNDLGNYGDNDTHLKSFFGSSVSLFNILQSYNGGHASGNQNTDRAWDGDQACEDSYSKCARRTMYDLQPYHEIVALPDSKRLYGYLVNWYYTMHMENLLINGITTLSFADNFKWGTPMDHGNEEAEFANDDIYVGQIGNSTVGYRVLNNWADYAHEYNWGANLSEEIFPRYMCRLGMSDGSFIYITFQKDYEGTVQDLSLIHI